MSDPFASLIHDARAFLADLGRNNSRGWFEAHKDSYARQLKAPALLFLDQVAADIARHGGGHPAVKLFRPQRNLRFSKDKTPYTTHLHMMWNLPGPAGTGLFFGIAPGYCTTGGGVMGFGKPELARWRAALDGRWGDEIGAMEGILALKGFAPRQPELARVPAPYGKAHPHGHLLRRKSLTFWKELPEAQWQRPAAAVMSAYLTLAPLFALLNEALAAEPA